MSETKQAGFDGGTIGGVETLSLPAPSQRDYALYVTEMSAELARLSDSANMPDEIAYLLRMASHVALDTAKKSSSGKGPRRGKPGT